MRPAPVIARPPLPFARPPLTTARGGIGYGDIVRIPVSWTQQRVAPSADATFTDRVASATIEVPLSVHVGDKVLEA